MAATEPDLPKGRVKLEATDFSAHLPAKKLRELNIRQLRGAFARSGASTIMWVFALLSFWLGSLNLFQFWGISASIIYLIFINLPIAFAFKKISRKGTFEFFSLLLNQLEIIGYTAIIYFCGGIEATYLTLIYAALIAYVGVAAPRRHSFIVAGLSSATYTLMVALDYLAVLPHMGIFAEKVLPLNDQLLVLCVVVVLLFVVAFLSGTASVLLRSQRDKLNEKNLEMAGANLKLRQEIEERSKVEDALRESEEKYRTILQNIEDGFYEVDVEGNFRFLNDYMYKILGYSGDELVGMNIRNCMDEKNADIVFESFDAVQRAGTGRYEVYSTFQKKDGSNIFVTMSVSLIKDGKDRPVGFRGIVRDITERKLIEEEKEKLKDRLQRAQKMEAIGTLAGGVAHDLNNILSGISTYPEFLLMDIPETSPLRKPIFRIQKSGEKAAAVVQDLLTLARRGVASTEPTNLNEIIEEYLDSLEYQKTMASYPQVRVEIDLDPGLFNIMGSRTHLFKTIMNLVSNAIESIKDEGMVRLSTSNRYIDQPIKGYDTVNEGEYVELIVEDTGAGLSDEDMERIFEPFYTKKIMGRSGTGLGMAVVWGTVKDHSGYINIMREEEKGSKVMVYFPITRLPLEKDKMRVKIEDYTGKGESILVVDDIAEQREIASKILAKLNYSVSSVASGEKALEFLKGQSVDLLVLDMVMDPGMDGLETFKKVLQVHPAQKAIIASGYSETERVREAQRLGVGRFIKKPYTIENIGMAVREELSEE